MPNLDLKQLRETFEKSTKGDVHKAIAHRAQMRMLDFLYDRKDGFAQWWDDTVKSCKDAAAIEDKLEEIIVKVLNELAPAHNTYSQLLDIAEAAEKMYEVTRRDDVLLHPSAIKPLKDAWAAYRKAREGK